jgi:selenocysteine lyase/cysteine desulfurase
MLTDTLRREAMLGLTEARPDFSQLRRSEFARLDADAHAYLDYTGSALYPASLVDAHAAMLREAVLGNPHSENPASLASSALIAGARSRVLRWLRADPAEYEVCFTANASGAIRLVAEAFPFAPDGGLVLSADNHNSVNGIREYARRAGAAVHYLPLDAELRLSDAGERLHALRRGRTGPTLFAYPAQSNFSGVKHSLDLVAQARAHGYAVLLDAASFVPTSRLDLQSTPADFVAVSFYKTFGYPSGVGALVARRSALAALRRPWFAGGTVDYVSVQNDSHLLHEGAEGFEDGTANFLAIGAVTAGLDFIDRVGVERIGAHAGALARRLAGALRSLRHANGRPLATLYGPRDMESCGAVVTFNVLDDAGRAVPFADVEARARAARVSVRGGCFCNPGAAEAAFGFPAGESACCLERTRREGWSLARFADCMQGHAVGALRASLGMASDERDVERLVAVVESYAAPTASARE